MAQTDDACTLLDEDHNQAARLLQQYKAAADNSHKRILAQKLFHELTVHMQIEEEVFYPAFVKATGDEHRVDDGIREHTELRALVARVDSAHPDDRLMLEIEDALLHHINDEREKMFPQARKAKGLDLMGLAGQLTARKSELMAPHAA